MMRVPLLLSALVALTTVSASGVEPLRISVSPAHSFAPTNLSVRARIVPNAENRILEIVAESVDFYRSSQIPLEGERSPSTFILQFRGLTGGEYVVSAFLTDGQGHRRAMDRQPVSVVSPWN
jgi:hypothetical protein